MSCNMKLRPYLFCGTNNNKVLNPKEGWQLLRSNHIPDFSDESSALSLEIRGVGGDKIVGRRALFSSSSCEKENLRSNGCLPGIPPVFKTARWPFSCPLSRGEDNRLGRCLCPLLAYPVLWSTYKPHSASQALEWTLKFIKCSPTQTYPRVWKAPRTVA